MGTIEWVISEFTVLKGAWSQVKPYNVVRLFTLPYLMGKVCYCLALRPPVGPMHIPELTVRLLEPLEFLANFKSVLQCSCLSSLGTRKCFPNCFLHFPTRALHLPRIFRLVIFFSTKRDTVVYKLLRSEVKKRVQLCVSVCWCMLLQQS